jgi:hypothetical protein
MVDEIVLQRQFPGAVRQPVKRQPPAPILHLRDQNSRAFTDPSPSNADR